jgi:dolichol kinase
MFFPCAYSAGAPRLALGLVLGVALGIAVLVEIVRRRSSVVGRRFDRAFGPMLRPAERAVSACDSRVSITGATWLALALFIAVSLLERGPAIAAMWCATAGDPAAALVGVWWCGRHRGTTPAVWARKSIPGSVACATASFVGVWLLAGFSWPAALGVAFVATLAERYSAPIDDNIAIVVSAGFAAQLL